MHNMTWHKSRWQLVYLQQLAGLWRKVRWPGAQPSRYGPSLHLEPPVVEYQWYHQQPELSVVDLSAFLLLANRHAEQINNRQLRLLVVPLVFNHLSPLLLLLLLKTKDTAISVQSHTKHEHTYTKIRHKAGWQGHGSQAPHNCHRGLGTRLHPYPQPPPPVSAPTTHMLEGGGLAANCSHGLSSFSCHALTLERVGVSRDQPQQDDHQLETVFEILQIVPILSHGPFSFFE